MEQMGNKNMESSLDAYDLEQIAKDYPQDHWQIIETLKIFVRNNAAYMPEEERKSNLSSKIRADIQAALTVIARRDVKKEPENQLLNLSKTDMSGANVNGANLEQAFWDVNLYEADTREAKYLELQQMKSTHSDVW